jgi:Tfp pilus assembly protein PilO
MKPKQFFFVVLGLIAVVVAAGGTGYYYANKYMKEKSISLSTRLAEQKAADEQIEKLNRLQIQYNRDVQPLMPQIDASLPREKMQSEVLAQVQRLAQANGMPFDGVTISGSSTIPSALSQTVKAGKVLAMPINFKVVGSYAQLQTFTSQLESLNRFTNITTLSVKREAAGKASYTYSLNAYIKP